MGAKVTDTTHHGPDVAMDDHALFALGTMTNSSPAMFERRRRILREARRMIGRGRIDDFNIRELCRRADVSSRTIYNAFGGKETVIALAINDYFESFHDAMMFAAPADTFEGALERQVATTLRNLQIPTYLHAVTALYFSPTLDLQISKVLRAIGQRPWLPWLQSLRCKRQIERGVDSVDAATDLSDIQFAKVHQWGVGEIADDHLLGATMRSVLTYASGAVRGEARARVRKAAEAMDRDSPEWREMVEDIRQRIDRQFARSAKDHVG